MTFAELRFGDRGSTKYCSLRQFCSFCTLTCCANFVFYFFIQDYIIAFCSGTLCSLEEAEIVWNENNNRSSQIDSALTKQAPSVVDIKKEECNRDHITQQAPSGVETTVLKTPSQIDSGFFSRTEISTDSSAESKEFDSQSQECADEANCTAPRTTEEMVVNRTVVSKTDEIEEKNKVRDSENTGDVAASGESLRDFAKKLGYHEDTIATGLSKLGPLADTNSLLSELVKAQSSVKQLEEGSSTFSYEKPHPALEDSSCLRPIVIDGSNVAMRYVSFYTIFDLGIVVVSHGVVVYSLVRTMLVEDFFVVNIRFIYGTIATSKTIEHYSSVCTNISLPIV